MNFNNYDNNDLPGISYFNNNATSNLDLNYNGNSDIPQNKNDLLDSGNESYNPTSSNNNGVESKQGKVRKKVTQACEKYYYFFPFYFIFFFNTYKKIINYFEKFMIN